MRARPLFAIFFALTAPFAGCATMADSEAPEGVDEAAAERGEAITLAEDMTTTEPPHATLNLAPGYDYGSVSTPEPDPYGDEVFTTAVEYNVGVVDAEIVVQKTWPGDHAEQCRSHSLSVKATARPNGGYVYGLIATVDEASAFYQTGGEFPQSGCRAKVVLPIAPNTARVRVMTQSRTRFIIASTPFYMYTAVSVSAKGTTPAPKFTSVVDVDSGGAATATVVNVGPVGVSLDADLEYKYDYCPPLQPGQPGDVRCVSSHLDNGDCQGTFCGPGTYGGLRQPTKCSWKKTSLPPQNMPAFGGVATWSFYESGTQAGCGLCKHSDGRCQDPYTYLTLKPITAPYNEMAPVHASGGFSGIF